MAFSFHIHGFMENLFSNSWFHVNFYFIFMISWTFTFNFHDFKRILFSNSQFHIKAIFRFKFELLWTVQIFTKLPKIKVKVLQIWVPTCHYSSLTRTYSFISYSSQMFRLSRFQIHGFMDFVCRFHGFHGLIVFIFMDFMIFHFHVHGIWTLWTLTVKKKGTQIIFHLNRMNNFHHELYEM